jgi:putative transposase
MARPLRVVGFSYVGVHRYFLTFCTYDRQEIFRTLDIVIRALEQICRTARDSKFTVLAYCAMPDHVHLLVEGNDDGSDLRRFVRRAKQGTAQVHAARHGGRLWQEGYYERVLRPDDDSLTVARYIVGNPVRAGLVQSPADYPLLGSDVWSRDQLIEGVTSSGGSACDA